ncbi:MAG: MG2 domain-containing protein [Ferruginibacter sp.]
MKFVLFISFILLCSCTSLCQQADWDQIESDIRFKAKLDDVNSKVEKIKQQALQQGNEISVARCFYYQMQIADLKTEDSLYFVNAGFIDSLLDNNKSPLMQSVLLILKAQRLENFRHNLFNKRNKSFFQLPSGSIDYRKLSRDELDSLVQTFLEQAKQISLQLPKQEVTDLLWLSSDPYLFLFKPGYTDIVFAEQLIALGNHYIFYSNTGNHWLTYTPRAFITSKNLPEGLSKTAEPMFTLYQQWARYHQYDSAAFYFIESAARKYFYTVQNGKDKTYNQYETYLQQLASSPYAPVRVHGVYQLCLLWKSYADRYEKLQDKKDRLYYVKTLDLIDKQGNLLDSFSYLKENLLYTKFKILEKKIKIQSKLNYLPGEPVSCKVSFRNTTAVHIRVIRLYDLKNRFNKYSIKTDSILQLPYFKDTIIHLPATEDYQPHFAVIDAGIMPPGYYAVLYSDSAINKKTKPVTFFTTSISNITAINNDSRVFILNRKTGMPLSGATVVNSIKKSKKKTVNREGYVLFENENTENIVAIYGNDTAQVKVTDVDINRKPNDVFDKEEEDLYEYYDNNMMMHVFTDRAIYRPGQTVYFKGILLTRNPSTGEQIVASRQNLKFSLFKRLFDEDVQEFRNDYIKSKLNILVNDAFGRTADTIKVTVNEYGSVSGSYKLNDQAVTGEWEFEPELPDYDDNNDGSFKVEEYKRPTFELLLEKPTTFLQLGDSFSVKAKLQSFSGAQLSNTNIDYTVTASFWHIIKDSTGKESTKKEEIEITDSSDHTDLNGELLVNVPANFLKTYKIDNKKNSEIWYTIEAEAVDATGESHEETLKVTLTNRPVKIDFFTSSIYERKELDSIAVVTSNQFSGSVNRELEAKIYKLTKPVPLKEEEWKGLDYTQVNGQWLYTEREQSNTLAENKTLIYKAMLHTNTEKLNLPKELLQAGEYKLEITCYENGQVTGEKWRNFSVFDIEKNSCPDTTKDFYHLPVNTVNRGELFQWTFGTSENNVYSIYHAQYFAKSNRSAKVKYIYTTRHDQKGISKWSFPMPADAVDKVLLTHLYILDNKLYKQSATVYVARAAAEEPEIIVEKYRKRLAPGSKETFTVSIKTKNENIAAELMTTMYDASLDKIEKFKWQKPYQKNDYYLRDRWSTSINSTGTYEGDADVNYAYHYQDKPSSAPLWWLNPLDYAYGKKTFTGFNNELVLNKRTRMVSNVSIAEDGLEEMVVIGYGTQLKQFSTSSLVTIRGVTSLSQYNIPLVIVDGQVYSGDISKINAAGITDGIILKGADAAAIYGARAADGVIIISTKGPLKLPQQEEAPVTTRKNFAETAFFFPQVYADKYGYYNISFDIPESVTEWNWKMLAHTKDARFIYAERKIVTQLPLMVQPNMPRFLYQGDMIRLQSRISNLDTMNLSGISNCMIEDAVTGEDITRQLTTVSKQNFTVDKRSNNYAAYNLQVPENLLHPLKIKIIARAGNFTDGEEYTIPVLNKKILVTQPVQFIFSNRTDSSITIPFLPADVQPYGIGLSISPQPQSALINALPYLAFYPYDCAEQTFNKIFAHALTLQLLRKDTVAQQALKSVSPGIITATAALPGELAEQTMPWLQLNHQVQLQQQQLHKLFDTLEGARLIEKHLADITSLQQSDGGIAWFKGGKSNPLISCYLLEGFGKIRSSNMEIYSIKASVNKIIPALIQYCDTAVKELFPRLLTQYLVARTYWAKDFPIPVTIATTIDSLLKVTWRDIQLYDLSRQAEAIAASIQFRGKENIFYNKAVEQLESIKQVAITDNTNGTRWKDISNKDDFSSSEEETISLLANAFTATGNSKAVVSGILKWLLNTKQQHRWSTTKATAAITDLLSRNQSAIAGSPSVLNVSANDSLLSATDNLFGGQLADFKSMTSFPPAVYLRASKVLPAAGCINFYYFTANPPANNIGVKISKKLFRENNGEWEAADEKTIFNIADRIKTIISIETPKQLPYVFIDEKRAAALEPANGSSGYRYRKDFNYYESVRDAGYQFFAEQIPSGISTIEYETIVAKEGIFNSGTVSLQCMYKLEVSAYSNGSIITTKNN